jgi:uncharacterized protein YrrD
MDEGPQIAYRVLEKGVPVVSSDGQTVGTVHHVVAAPEQDIFHGLVISVGKLDHRFVAADEIDSLHELGVDLRIDAEAAARLPTPSGAAPEYREDPTETRWDHWARRLTGRKDWRRSG